MSRAVFRALVGGLLALAVGAWLASLALPVAYTTVGRPAASHGIFYLLWGWAGPAESGVWGWYAHLPAVAALVLLAAGSVRPWRGTARAALALAFVLALVALPIALHSEWAFSAVRVLGPEQPGQVPLRPATSWEVGFYVWIGSFAALILATLAAATSAWLVTEER